MSKYNLENNTLPLLTTKKLAWKTCLKELLWFISGSTDNGVLQKQKVKIWDANANNDFKRKQGIWYKDENDLGPIYGHQWRHFNASYTDCHSDYTNQGVDQLKYIIDKLKDPKSRASRRLILSAWNPCQLSEMALPPCHILMQFNVVNKTKLECALYQRSGDVGLGVPFNIASYSFLTHLIAKHCDLEVDEFIYFMGNVHIYDDHIKPLKQQIENNILEFPTLRINIKRDNIDDYKLEDFDLLNYKHNDVINMKMRK
jgi:thymidylate synthase